MTATPDAIGFVLSAEALAALDRHIDRRVEAALAAREDEKRWLDTDEAATYLGVTPSAIRKQVARGQLPYTRHNRRLLIDKRALDAQLERQSR